MAASGGRGASAVKPPVEAQGEAPAERGLGAGRDDEAPPAAGEQSMRRKLTVDVAGTTILRVSGQGLHALTAVVLARMLRADGYGMYSLPLAVVQLLTVPALLGLPQLVTRTTARYLTARSFGLLRGLITRVNQYGAIMAAALMAGSAAVYAAIGHPGSRVQAVTFYVAMLVYPFIVLRSFRTATLRGLHKVLLSMLPEELISPLLFLAGVLLMSRWTMGPSLAMALQVIASGVGFAAGSVLLVRSLPGELRKALPAYETRVWLRSSWPFMLLAAAQVVNTRTDIVMLGAMRPIAEVGVYRAVVQLSSLVTVVLLAASTALGPQLVRLWQTGERESLQRLVTLASRLVAVGTLAGGGFLAVFGGSILTWLFGKDFSSGAGALRILCAGQVVNGLAGSVGVILNMTGHERRAAAGVAICAGLNVVLNAVLIPPLGIDGAAIATAISLTVWNVLLLIWVRRLTGLRSTALGFL